MRPSDVRNEQSSRYQELAKTFAQGWDDMRDKLLQCDLEYSDAPVEDATTEGVDQGSSYAQPQVELGVESDQPIEVVDSPGQSQSGLDTTVSIRRKKDLECRGSHRPYGGSFPSD